MQGHEQPYSPIFLPMCVPIFGDLGKVVQMLFQQAALGLFWPCVGARDEKWCPGTGYSDVKIGRATKIIFFAVKQICKMPKIRF